MRFWCEAPRANRADDPVIEPVKIFDNVYAIGNVGTVAYVIQTSAGLMMIDALGRIRSSRISCQDSRSLDSIRHR